MELQSNDERPLKRNEASVPTERMTRDILLLHFTRGMSPASIATIFSLSREEVEEKISNFSRQFSNRTYLMNVINGLASMKIKRDKAQGADKALTDKDREIADLRRRLTEAEIRAEAYEEMVRLAEVTYGISIRKKSGAK